MTQSVASQDQEQFEVEFFNRILERNPRNVDSLRCLADLMASSGDYAKALGIDLRLIEVNAECEIAHYNLACSLARLGRFEEALVSLENALRTGYDDLAHLAADPDLDGLRDHPGFLSLIHAIVGDAEAE